MRYSLTISCLFLLFFLPHTLWAQLRLAPVFSSHMVLQREQPITIWGKGPAGKSVTVTFGSSKARTTIRQDSSWSLTLPKQPANTSSQTLSIHCGNEQLILQNIVLGDVWLCIGQSNMEWPMRSEKHFREERPNSLHPSLRFLNPTYAGKNTYNTAFSDSILHRLQPDSFYQGSWASCDSLSIQNMSAVAYYFGKQILGHTQIPIGLINISIGGAPLETFISPEALQNHPTFKNKVTGNWLTNNALPVWIRERGQQNVGSLPNTPSDALGKHHGYKPGFAYTAGIEPLLPLPIKGILCYQGESNAQEIERVNEYAELTTLMVTDFRKKWKNPDLPYYFVQLSSIDTIRYKGQLWPEFRDVQRQTLTLLPHSGMAVCTDIGAPHDVHPTNKKLVGERLARWALHHQYNENIETSGPLPEKAVYENGQIIVSFKHIAQGLTTMDIKSIRGFSIDGKQEINAATDGKKIYIACPSKPSFVYYGWKPYTDANLCNSENLPASTFRIAVQ